MIRFVWFFVFALFSGLACRCLAAPEAKSGVKVARVVLVKGLADFSDEKTVESAIKLVKTTDGLVRINYCASSELCRNGVWVSKGVFRASDVEKAVAVIKNGIRMASVVETGASNLWSNVVSQARSGVAESVYEALDEIGAEAVGEGISKGAKFWSQLKSFPLSLLKRATGISMVEDYLHFSQMHGGDVVEAFEDLSTKDGHYGSVVLLDSSKMASGTLGDILTDLDEILHGKALPMDGAKGIEKAVPVPECREKYKGLSPGT